jgi:hypothetical protein
VLHRLGERRLEGGVVIMPATAEVDGAEPVEERAEVVESAGCATRATARTGGRTQWRIVKKLDVDGSIVKRTLAGVQSRQRGRELVWVCWGRKRAQEEGRGGFIYGYGPCSWEVQRGCEGAVAGQGTTTGGAVESVGK